MKKHTHKYERIKWGKKGTIIFRCAYTNCSHYILREIAKGRSSICWSCGTEFTLSAPDLQRHYPKCSACTTSKKEALVTEPVEAPVPKVKEPEKPSIPALPDNFNIDDLLENL